MLSAALRSSGQRFPSRSRGSGSESDINRVVANGSRLTDFATTLFVNQDDASVPPHRSMDLFGFRSAGDDTIEKSHGEWISVATKSGAADDW
jgi:hypothetical protein